MTTAMVAGRLIELCTVGKFIQAQQELYDTNIKSIDPDGSQTAGASNMQAKERRFLDNLEKIHNSSFSDPLIAGNYFTVVLKMAIEVKNKGYKEFEEICVYQVANGKIIFEQFFRDVQKII
jgi:hypothetical protein